MRRFAVSIVAAGFAAVVLPHAAAAQCEGGVTVAGFYARDGTYVPGHCAYTNPTTPGQLYPSGAQPVPSTNPALGASRLPGQIASSGLLPVNSSDLGPAPSYANSGPLQAGGVAAGGPSLGPGTPLNAVNASTTTATLAGSPDQFPQTGLPALNGNRAVPSSLTTANGSVSTAPGLVTAVGATTVTNLSQANTAYGMSLGAAPPREEPTPGANEQSDTVIVTFPNQ